MMRAWTIWEPTPESTSILDHGASLERRRDDFDPSIPDDAVLLSVVRSGGDTVLTFTDTLECFCDQSSRNPRKSGDMSDMVHRIKTTLGRK